MLLVQDVITHEQTSCGTQCQALMGKKRVSRNNSWCNRGQMDSDLHKLHCQIPPVMLHFTTWLPPANLFLPSPTKRMGSSGFV